MGRDVTDELPQDVEAYLDTEERVATEEYAERPTAERPAIDLSLALKLMRRLGRLRHNAAQHTAALRAEAARIEQAIGEIEALAERRAQPIEALLKMWHASRLAEDPRAKTVSLAPYGSLHATKRKVSVALADSDAAFAWAADNAPEYIRTKPDLDWSKLKGACYVTPDGKVVNVTTGEAIPGVAVVEAHTDFRMEVAE